MRPHKVIVEEWSVFTRQPASVYKTNAVEIAAPNPAVGKLNMNKTPFAANRYLTGTNSPTTNVYEYPVEAESPMRVWPPIRTGRVLAVAPMIDPTTPTKTPHMKNHRRPNMSVSLPTRVRPRARPSVYTSESQITGPGPIAVLICPKTGAIMAKPAC